MASAIKCDRCASYYDKLESIRHINGYRINGIDVTTRSSANTHYDLCGKCIEDLYSFLNLINNKED